MAYDELSESVRLIETGSLVPRTSLSRRRRHLALAVDVQGNYAVTVFARRSGRRTVVDSWVLVRREGSWSVLFGSPGSNAEGSGLQHRPARLDAGLPPELGLNSHVALASLAKVRDTCARSVVRPGGRFVHYGSVQVSAAVVAVSIGTRRVLVPWHGEVALVWTGRRRRIKVWAEDGTLLGRERLSAW